MSRLILPRTLLALGLAGSVLSAAACGSDSDNASTDTASTDTAAADTAAADGTAGGSEPTVPATSSSEPVTLRLGYFPNVTHAPAIVGVENGLFAEALGDNVELEPTTFNAGTEAIEAIFSDAIDATFIGPNPAINAFAKSNGEAIRIVVGHHLRWRRRSWFATKHHVAGDLAGAKIATPSLGNTQDVALRAWLLEQGSKPTPAVAATSRSSRRTTPTRWQPSRPGHSTEPGCPSRGRPGSCSKAAARSSSTSATCGPTASSSPPT